MPARRLQCAPGVLLLALLGTGLLPSVSRAQGDPAPIPSRTVLQTGTRLVVEDVLVMNAKGEPVHNLPRSAFHVFDEDRPQTIRNFEEGSQDKATLDAPPPLPPGAFSNNSYLYSSSLVSDVFLINADQLPARDQMFLLQQLRQSIDALPAGVQASIFCEVSGHPVQLQGLTANHADLQSGVAECIPRLPSPPDMWDEFESGRQQLLSVASVLQPLPGRKNILWFAGPFPLMPTPGNEQVKRSNSAAYESQTEAIHQLQNLLAEARISVYPIDPRGVLLAGMPSVTTGNKQEGNRMPSATLSGSSGVSASFNTMPTLQYDYMEQFAESTGGTSSHLNNLAEQINRAMSLGQDAYSLSYSPSGYNTDNSWHSIRVTVDGPYRISYRRGYLATWVAPPAGGSGAAGRLLTVGDKAHSTEVAAPSSDKPLIFTVQRESPATTSAATLPQPHYDNRIQVSVTIPVQQLGFTHDGGTWHSSATVAAYAYDDYGKLKGGEQQQLDSALSDEQWKTAQSSQVATHQAFNMPRSARYVLFVVTDKTSRRKGTLMVPIRALHPDA